MQRSAAYLLEHHGYGQPPATFPDAVFQSAILHDKPVLHSTASVGSYAGSSATKRAGSAMLVELHERWLRRVFVELQRLRTAVCYRHIATIERRLGCRQYGKLVIWPLTVRFPWRQLIGYCAEPLRRRHETRHAMLQRLDVILGHQPLYHIIGTAFFDLAIWVSSPLRC